jgi:3-phosphoinositide dependent protein kinase-1
MNARASGTPRPEDLEWRSLLGVGAFARVLHVKHVRSGENYAMKVVDKRQAQLANRTSSIIAERNLLASLDHAGIVRYHFSFESHHAYYFALELVEGGELATQIYRMGQCPLDFVQFYTAEIIVILEYLQGRHIAHRDLKPENLLVTLNGHLKLIDFDAAVLVPGEGEGDAAGGCGQGEQVPFAGTSSYLPPEALDGFVNLREAFACDLWALGCIIFYMLLGTVPFKASTEYLLFQAIRNCEYNFPGDFPHQAAQHLVQELLVQDPGARAGLGKEGLDALKRHAFFGVSRIVANFDAILLSRPPQRVDRIERAPYGAAYAALCAESEASSTSFDFSECTPEIGQNFLAKSSKTVFDSGRQEQWHGSSLHRKNASCNSLSSKKSSFSQQLLKPTSHLRSFNISGLPASSFESRLSCAARCNLQELVERCIIRDGEDVILSGNVVQRCRWFSCFLRPQILMLTDRPRLLLLDPSGRRLLKEIPLASPGTHLKVTQSPFDFQIHTQEKIYKCHDVNILAEAWERHFDAACERVLRRPL